MTDKMKAAVDLMARSWNAPDAAKHDELDKQIEALGLTPAESAKAFIQMRAKQPGSAFVIGKAPDGDTVIISLGTGSKHD